MPDPHSPAKGKQFGRYVIESELGRGGMGIVYKALDPQLRRPVALKVLLGDPTDAEGERVKRFLREATSIAKLRHPNVVQIHDISKVGDQHYFTMDFIDGASLEKKVREAHAGKREPPRIPPAPQGTGKPPTKSVPALGRGLSSTTKTVAPGPSLRAAELSRIETAGPYNLLDTLALVRDMARALGAAHAQGIVHRDVKPANILIDAKGTPFLTDFGLAKEVGELGRSVLTLSGTVLGTPKYMSPEQAAGRVSDIQAPSDVWSLGVVLYEMLSGKAPFEAAALGDLLHDIAKKSPPAPSAAAKGRKGSSGAVRPVTADQAAAFVARSQGVPRIPTPVDEITMKCLEKDPEYRYPDGNALADDIDRFLRGQEIEADATVALQQSRITAARARSRAAAREKGARQTLVMLLVGVPIAVVGLLVFLSASRRHEQEARHDAALAEAGKLIEARQWKKAQELINLRLAEWPGDPALDQKRVEVEDQIGKVHDALTRGDQAFERKDYVVAQAAFRDALVIDPNDARAKARFEDCAGLLYRLEDAIGKGEALLEGEDWEGARKCFEEALAISPNDPRARTGAEKAKNAVAVTRRDPTATPGGAVSPRRKEAEPFYQRARSRPAETRDVWEEALANVEKALSIDPEYGDAWYERGVLHQKLGRPPEALQDYAKAVQFGSFVVYAHYIRGRILFDDYGDMAQARMEFEAAINADPTHEYVLAARARMAAADGDLDRALQLAQQALQRTKTLDDVWFVLGYVYGQDRYLDLDKAIECLNKAIELNPTVSASWGNRATVRYMRKEFNWGLVDAEKAIELTNGAPNMLEKRALNLKGMEKYPEAIATYDEAIKRAGDTSVSLYANRGDCYRTWGDSLRAGDPAGARARYEKSVADIEKAIKLMPPEAAWEPYRQQFQKAIAALRNAIEDLR